MFLAGVTKVIIWISGTIYGKKGMVNNKLYF